MWTAPTFKVVFFTFTAVLLIFWDLPPSWSEILSVSYFLLFKSISLSGPPFSERCSHVFLLCHLVTVLFLPPMVFWPLHSQIPPSRQSRKILLLLMSGSSERGSSSRVAQPLVTQLFPLQQHLYSRGHILSRGGNGSVTHNLPLNLRTLCPQSCSPYCPVISFPHSQISPCRSPYLTLERPVFRAIYMSD